MEELEKYTVISTDKNFAVLQSFDKEEIKMVEILLLPVVKKGDVLVYKDDLYMIDNEERRKRLETIKERLNKLKDKKID